MAERTPAELIVDLSSWHMVARSLHVIAEMGVADALGDHPATAEDIAARVKAHPDALRRVLRLLATHDVFAEEDGKFVHTEASRQLRQDHPQSLRPWVRMMGMPLNWGAYGAFEHSLRTGTSARDTQFEGNFFADYLPKHPDIARLFNEAMSSAAGRRIEGVVKAYDFSSFATIADIGGGRGHLISGVLEATPKAKGILFDLPQAVDPIRDTAGPRLTIIGGDFFKTPLPAADLYVLMAVVHDWSDEESVTILKAVRKAAPPHAKLMLLERVIMPGPTEGRGRRMDIHMLAALSGRERTQPEFEALFRAAGFKLDRVITTSSEMSIIEGAITR